MEGDLSEQVKGNLRKSAEELLPSVEHSDAEDRSDADIRVLLHELQVHQVELEMQNEELQRTRQEAEEALRRYSDLYDFAPVGYLTLDEHGNVVDANLTASSMLGVPRSQLVGAPFILYIGPSSRQTFRGLCEEASQSGRRASREMTLLRERRAPFFALAEAASEANAFPCRLTITDITRRKEAEESLRVAYADLEVRVQERTRELAIARAQADLRAAEMESFFASIPDGAILFDEKGRVTLINKAARGLLGAPEQESFEDWFGRFRAVDMDGSVLPVDERAVARALGGELTTDTRAVLVTPWGREVTIAISAAPVLDARGNVTGATVVFRDQTERVALESGKQALLEREQHIAKVLEKAVIPEPPAEVPGLSVAVKYKAALSESGVGGDFYDIFELDNGKVGVLIGDIAGKGLAAAVGVAGVRHSIRSYAYLDPRPSRVLTLVNSALCRSAPSREELGMVTAFFAVVDTRFGGISYATGGHEPALLKTAGGEVERLTASGPIMGVLADAEYEEFGRKLYPGDKIVMVTDGITEARPSPQDLFGIEGVETFLQECMDKELDALATGILDTAKSHAGGAFADDAAIVVISLKDGS